MDAIVFLLSATDSQHSGMRQSMLSKQPDILVPVEISTKWVQGDFIVTTSSTFQYILQFVNTSYEFGSYKPFWLYMST